MRSQFPGYYQPTADEFDQIWQTGTFVVDANVLLNVYRFSESARDDLLKVLRRVADRLWIPHQVALEYQANRLSVIVDHARRFSDVKQAVRASLSTSDLRKKLEGFRLKKWHSSIDADPLLKSVDELVESFSNELDQKHSDQLKLLDNNAGDPLRLQIEALLQGKVGAKPSEAELNDRYKRGDKRFEEKRPPGYKDAGKEPEFLVSGTLVIRRKFGDLILWEQLLTHVKDSDLQAILFVTDDTKEDWWWKVGGRTIGPRPELVEEIHSVKPSVLFHMYNTEQFLKFAQTYFTDLRIDNQSIQEAKDVRSLVLEPTQVAERIIGYSMRDVHAAIAAWLRSDPNVTVTEASLNMAGHAHLVACSSKGTIGYQIKVVPVQVADALGPPLRHFFDVDRHVSEGKLGIEVRQIIVFYPVDARYRVAVRAAIRDMNEEERRAVIFGYLRDQLEPDEPRFVFHLAAPTE